MEQWLYLFLTFAALIGGWRVARPWVERRIGVMDHRAPMNHSASAEARERRLLDKTRSTDI